MKTILVILACATSLAVIGCGSGDNQNSTTESRLRKELSAPPSLKGAMGGGGPKAAGTHKPMQPLAGGQ
ncbi:MAG: hypothetical protein P4L46_25260 [Fimbriimonas sp.]|nr:hypothetical protein [Fimbriimonas sp.]